MRKTDRKRRKIIDPVFRLFRGHGFEHTTMAPPSASVISRAAGNAVKLFFRIYAQEAGTAVYDEKASTRTGGAISSKRRGGALDQ